MRFARQFIMFAALVSPALAQNTPQLPGAKDAARVTDGTYAVDTGQTLVQWQVNHFGFNDYFGLFGGATGSLTLNKADASKYKVSIDIPLSGLTTTNAKLNAHLSSPDFFDVAKFATAHFESTSVVTKGNRAEITGALTLHGVTKPVTLDAHFTGAGTNPMSKKVTVGFQAKTTIKRSDFGMSAFVPLVSDEVDLKITAAFEK